MKKNHNNKQKRLIVISKMRPNKDNPKAMIRK